MLKSPAAPSSTWWATPPSKAATIGWQPLPSKSAPATPPAASPESDPQHYPDTHPRPHLWRRGRWCDVCRSVGGDVVFLNRTHPALDFLLQKRLLLGRGDVEQPPTIALDAGNELGLAVDLRHGFAQLGHHGGRGACGGKDAKPALALKTCQAGFVDGGHLGQERAARSG